MPQLHWLDLSYNLLKELEYDSFRNTRRIQVLTSGANRFKDTINVVHLFQVLYLSQNQLVEIPQEIFKPLFELRIVGISHNNLRSLPDGLFINQGVES